MISKLLICVVLSWVSLPSFAEEATWVGKMDFGHIGFPPIRTDIPTSVTIQYVPNRSLTITRSDILSPDDEIVTLPESIPLTIDEEGFLVYEVGKGKACDCQEIFDYTSQKPVKTTETGKKVVVGFVKGNEILVEILSANFFAQLYRLYIGTSGQLEFFSAIQVSGATPLRIQGTLERATHH